MKKIVIVAVFLFVGVLSVTFGQTEYENKNQGGIYMSSIMLSPRGMQDYSKHFVNGNGDIARRYYREATDSDYNTVAALGGDVQSVDTPLEIALLSAATGVVNIRPVEAVQMLGDAKRTDLTLGAEVFKQIQILRFLGNTAAVGRYEANLKIITDRGNVTRADIEAYYRSNNGIRSLVSQAVEEQFNKVAFVVDNTATRTSYDAVLTRKSQNEYVLEYERLGTKYEPITATSLEALSSVMSRNSNFNQTSVDQLRAQAALIPAAILSSGELNSVRDILTSFYLNPNITTYNALRDVHAIYDRLSKTPGSATTYNKIAISYIGAVDVLSEAIGARMVQDVRNNPSVVSRLDNVSAIAQQIQIGLQQ